MICWHLRRQSMRVGSGVNNYYSSRVMDMINLTTSPPKSLWLMTTKTRPTRWGPAQGSLFEAEGSFDV